MSERKKDTACFENVMKQFEVNINFNYKINDFVV